MTRRIDISWKTIIFIAVFLLGLWILYQIIDLILLLFVAIIFMSAISPLVIKLVSLRIPKALGILLVYVVVLGILGGLLTVIFTPLINETTRLFLTLPPVVAELLKVGNIDQSVLQSQFSDFSKNLFSFTKTIFDNFITIIFLIVLTFYLLIERENLEKRASLLFAGKEERVRQLLVEIEEKLGAWMRGQLILSIIIGGLVYLGLSILQIPFALSLAILAGLLEVVPVIGPIISAVPAILLGLTISPLLAGGVTAMYFVIQQLENHLIVPQVMRKAVGLNPLVVILAIAVGGRLLGISGALLAVPVTVVIQVIFLDILKERKT